MKGYKPLQLKYNGRVIDFVFRGGAKNCNNGDTVVKMIQHLVERIRVEYDRESLILLTADNAFFDQTNFRAFKELDIGYVVGGKKYQDLKERADQQSEEDWERVQKSFMNEARGETTYRITSFRDRRGSWEKKRTLQQEFVNDDFPAIASTNALGMGIDKHNMRFVIHVDVPGSITSYYQEVGRAGRDRNPSRGILLFDENDREI